MSSRLRLKDFVKKSEACHFARIELHHRIGTPHDHDFTELFWVESGRILHWINGERRVLDSGTLIFVLPEDLHDVSAAAPGEKAVICNLAFPRRAWESVRRRFLRRQPDWFHAGPPRKREHALLPLAFHFLRRAGFEMIPAPRSALILERFFLNLAVALQEARTLPSVRAPLWLSQAVARVDREGLFREGPAALTRLAGRSQEHVVRETKRWFEKTPTSLINEMRMRHAAAALGTTQREILDLCYDCGLENIGHFYALFKKSYGMTPRQYRLNSQSIVNPPRAP